MEVSIAAAKPSYSPWLILPLQHGLHLTLPLKASARKSFHLYPAAPHDGWERQQGWESDTGVTCFSWQSDKTDS